MRRLISSFVVTGAVLAAVVGGSAGTARASATLDLIWADTGTNVISNVGVSSVITLQVILTAGPAGSQGAGVSVDYGGVAGLSVVSFASTTGGPLPLFLGTTSDTGSRVQNINSTSFPPYVGSGLSAGQSHQLGTVTFNVGAGVGSGAFEIFSDADGPTDDVLDLNGNVITSTTAFNSALLCNGGGPCSTPVPTPTASATPTSTSAPTPTATATPTATPIITPPTPTPTFPPTPTATSTPHSPTPTPTATPTSSATPTVTASPTATPRTSARIDLIWADNGTDTIGPGVPDGSEITLQVILTAGSGGSQGAGVSVDYSGVVGLSVVSFASTEGGPLPLMLGTTTDTGSRVENINSASFPPYEGTGLLAGQSHQLGTVTFNKSGNVGNGTFEIRSDADGPTDDVLDLNGNVITFTTAFKSAYLVQVGTFPTPTQTPQPTPTVTPSATPSFTPTATPPIPTPSATPSFTPTATPIPTPSATPTATPTAEPTPLPCSAAWPQTTFVTKAKGQKPSNNEKLTHTIRGHIIEPDSLSDTAHRIPVCAGTEVTSAITDASGTPTNTASGSLVCTPAGCSGVVNETEKYQSTSADGKDKDSITFLPK